MSKLGKEKSDKLYEDGFRDAQHGGKPNTPHQDWHPFMRDQFLQENTEYKKGYAAGESAKKSK